MRHSSLRSILFVAAVVLASAVAPCPVARGNGDGKSSLNGSLNEVGREESERDRYMDWMVASLTAVAYLLSPNADAGRRAP